MTAELAIDIVEATTGHLCQLCCILLAATHLHLDQTIYVKNDTSLTEIVWAVQKALLLFYTGQVSAVVVLIAELVTICNDVGLLTPHLAQPMHSTVLFLGGCGRDLRGGIVGRASELSTMEKPQVNDICAPVSGPCPAGPG